MTFHPGIQETGHYLAEGRSMLGRIDAFAPNDPPPQRALRVVIDAHADTLDDLRRVFDDIAFSLRNPKAMGGTSGSVSAGYHFEVERRDVDHDQFVEELFSWKEANR